MAIGRESGDVDSGVDGGSPPLSEARVVVCGWELSHNAAGRAATLVELYQRAQAGQVSLIGCLFPKWGSELWAPLQGMPLTCDLLSVQDTGEFFKAAEAMVERNPADIVHLSKPRLPNVIIGLLYKRRWGARVLIDIDDEELGFVGSEQPYTGPVTEQECPEDLTGKRATELSVGLAARCFDGVTVSNPALQKRYGGEIIPHARSENHYAPSVARRTLNRELFGIPLHRKVVLFSGTPRRHKGIMDIARALAELGRSDVQFVLVGDFPFADVKEELKAIRGVNLKFIPGQPYWHTPDVVSVADCVVLVQELTSSSAQLQAPAKLTDALAMGVTVLAQSTPGIEDLHRAGAFIDVTPDNLGEKLAEALAENIDPEHSRARAVFLEKLSNAVVSARLKACAEQAANRALTLSDSQWESQASEFRSTIVQMGEDGRFRLAHSFVEFLQEAAASLAEQSPLEERSQTAPSQ